MVTDQKITMMWADDEEHDKCFLELYCDGKFAFLVRQKENNDLCLEFPDKNSDENYVQRKFELLTLVKMIELAKNIILNKAEIPHGMKE